LGIDRVSPRFPWLLRRLLDARRELLQILHAEQSIVVCGVHPHRYLAHGRPRPKRILRNAQEPGGFGDLHVVVKLLHGCFSANGDPPEVAAASISKSAINAYNAPAKSILMGGVTFVPEARRQGASRSCFPTNHGDGVWICLNTSRVAPPHRGTSVSTAPRSLVWRPTVLNADVVE
jgi:hypothetical protein